MNGNPPRNYYWDANIYFAWLLQESTHSAYLPAIDFAVRENIQRKIKIVTSAITRVEVTALRLSSAQETQFQSTFRPGDHEIYDVDIAIADKARGYCAYYMQHPKKHATKPNKTAILRVPDAIHLATAVIIGADIFWTMDGGKKDGFSLLALNGNVAGDRLSICRPKLPAGYLGI